jgi:hypothetical protein
VYHCNAFGRANNLGIERVFCLILINLNNVRRIVGNNTIPCVASPVTIWLHRDLIADLKVVVENGSSKSILYE